MQKLNFQFLVCTAKILSIYNIWVYENNNITNIEC
jgi:hypothetical protein